MSPPLFTWVEGSHFTFYMLLRRSQTVEQLVHVAMANPQGILTLVLPSLFYFPHSFLSPELTSLKYSLKNILMASCQYLLIDLAWSTRERKMILNFRPDELEDENCRSLRQRRKGDAVVNGHKSRADIWIQCF